jgi:tripartite-type tricarboxylate transporter receptor subunit TctC
MLSRAANVELTAVHYKGGAPALQDLLGGQIPISVNPVGEVLPFARAGKIRVLVTTGLKRSRFLPDTPTMAESGFRDVAVEAWLGFFAPARTPGDVIAKLNAAITDAVRGADVIESFAKFGVDASAMPSTEFAALVRADIERWGPIVKASSFTAED